MKERISLKEVTPGCMFRTRDNYAAKCIEVVSGQYCIRALSLRDQVIRNHDHYGRVLSNSWNNNDLVEITYKPTDIQTDHPYSEVLSALNYFRLGAKSGSAFLEELAVLLFDENKEPDAVRKLRLIAAYVKENTSNMGVQLR